MATVQLFVPRAMACSPSGRCCDFVRPLDQEAPVVPIFVGGHGVVDVGDADGGVENAPSIRGIQHKSPDAAVNLSTNPEPCSEPATLPPTPHTTARALTPRPHQLPGRLRVSRGSARPKRAQVKPASSWHGQRSPEYNGQLFGS